MARKDPSIQQLVVAGDIERLARRCGYRTRFGGWRLKDPGGGTSSRVEAVEGLAEMLGHLTRGRGGEARERIDRLVVLLAVIGGDPDGSVRSAAMQGLGRSRREEAIAILTSALADPEPPVREAAAAALLDNGRGLDGPARTALIASLADPEPAVHQAAQRTLGRYGGSAAVAPLEASGSAIAIETLAAMAKAVPPVPDADVALQRLATTAPDAYFEAVVDLDDRQGSGLHSTWRDHLLELAADPALPDLTRRLIAHIGNRPPTGLLDFSLGSMARSLAARPGSGPLLLDLLRAARQHPGATGSALDALRQAGEAAPLEDLVFALGMDDGRVSDLAGAMVAQLGPDARQPLLRVASDTSASPTARRAALAWLANHPDPADAGRLADIVLAEPELTASAASALAAATGGPHPPLVQLGIWLGSGSAVEVDRWLKGGAAGADMAEAQTFILDRLDPLSLDRRVEVVAAVLSSGGPADHPAVQGLISTLRAMASKQDEVYTDVEAGDQDMYVVEKVESHAATRTEGCRLLERLGIE